MVATFILDISTRQIIGRKHKTWKSREPSNGVKCVYTYKEQIVYFFVRTQNEANGLV